MGQEISSHKVGLIYIHKILGDNLEKSAEISKN